jgi:hypothetical protein
MEELAASHPSTSMVIQSLNQVHQYLDSEHQEHVEEMSNIAAISDNLESDSPFAGTAASHIYMLMVWRESFCRKYNEHITTIDGLITYINDLQPLGSNLYQGGSKEESMTNVQTCIKGAQKKSPWQTTSLLEVTKVIIYHL